jgi:hypothetical protein
MDNPGDLFWTDVLDRPHDINELDIYTDAIMLVKLVNILRPWPLTPVKSFACTPAKEDFMYKSLLPNYDAYNGLITRLTNNDRYLTPDYNSIVHSFRNILNGVICFLYQVQVDIKIGRLELNRLELIKCILLLRSRVKLQGLLYFNTRYVGGKTIYNEAKLSFIDL